MVIAGGQVVAQNGRIAIDIPPYAYPDFAVGTVRLGKRLEAGDFEAQMTTDHRLQTTDESPSSVVGRRSSVVKVRVIGVVENQAPTKALERTLPVIDGIIQNDPAQDVCRIALVERHRATGDVTNGFVSGFGFNVPCAVASTVAHDSHHMIVVGTDAADMARAANRLGEVGGGVVVFKEGKEISLVELPIAGLMSNERAEVVAAKAKRMVEAFAECGCTLHNAYMQLSLLALVVIPELRISDKGIVDVRTFEVVPLMVN
jgi:adenine deaminase